MKTSSGRSRKIITAAACAAAALATLAAIAPQARAGYGSEFTFDVGTFLDGRAYGIAAGQPVGYGGGNGWLWSSPAISLTPAGYVGSVANATSGAQQVGSSSNAAGQRAILWSGTAASAVDLTPAGFSSATALGVGGGKQVGVGAGTPTGGNQHALLWAGTAASRVDLHPAGFVSSAALATSGSQQVGSAVDASSNSRAMLWSGTAASAIDLTPSGFSTAIATGVANGQQVGYSGGHALLWSGTAASCVDLSPIGTDFSQASATNGTQQVGFIASEDSVGVIIYAAVWSGTADGAVNLSSYVPVAERYDDHYATSIDAYGNVAGYSHNRAYNFGGAVEWLNGNLFKLGGTGAWSTSTNWMSGTPATGHDVMLLQADATNRTITYSNNNSAIVLGKLTIDATGSGAVTVSQAQDSLKATSESIGVVGKGVFNQTGGTHTVTGALTLAERAGSSGSYTLSDGALAAGATVVNSGGVFNYNGGSCSLGDLALNGTGRVTVGAGGGKVLNAKSVAIAAAAKLDLGGNAMSISYTGASPLATIATYIHTGYAGGSWTGNGITSSAAAAASTSAHKTALGYAEAGAIGAGSSSVVVRYTFAGDANLTGGVDLTDFTYLAANFNKTGGAVWLDGDFNYDGNVDLTDFTFLAANFNQSLPLIAGRGSPGSSVPEPTLMSSLISVSLLLPWRRRRVSRACATSV